MIHIRAHFPFELKKAKHTRDNGKLENNESPLVSFHAKQGNGPLMEHSRYILIKKTKLQ